MLEIENGIHPKIGLVVPTLGQRLTLLEEALKSGRAAGADHILLVTKSASLGSTLKSSGLVDDYRIDQAAGLAAAIADGLRQLPKEIGFINWLADDDLLAPNSLLLLREVLNECPSETPFAYGRCSYIDVDGNKLFVMPTGKWATSLMRVGPQLISRPACLFRREAVTGVGGLDSSLRWAFDLDLLLRLSRHRRPIFVSQQVASFRWHSESLSVGSRSGSVGEAAGVRKRHLRGALRVLVLADPFISKLILYAGSLVSWYARVHRPIIVRQKRRATDK